MSGIPTAVRIAALGIGIHAIDHIIVLLWPPFEWHIGTVFHLISGPVYALLVLPVLRGRNWARITISLLLGGQFIGRFVVWVLFPTGGAHAALLVGWTISVIVLALLWIPARSRQHF
ncbi:hypothetical protein [Nocardia sp. NPDC052112]|uniref:hypothetical protein n=1 Tax=Nocardia sp. NPDC052112 TaxID=3155646 RepID=UPI00342E18CF